RRKNAKTANFNLDGLELHVLFFARELVSRNALNFLGRKWRRHLLDHANEFCGNATYLIQVDPYFLLRANQLAFGVVGVGDKPEADFALVGLSRRGIKLSEASHSP